MEIYVYNRDFEPLGLIDAYTSLQWNRRYSSPGDFELVAPLTPETVALLKSDHIIWPSGDPEAGFIYYRDLKLDENFQEVIDIKGKFLTGYLSRRIPWTTVNYTGTAEAAMRDIVLQNAANITDSSRAIPHLVVAEAAGFTPTVNYQVKPTTDKNLNDDLSAIAQASELGYRIRFDPENKRMIFEVYAGIDRTVGQSINPRAVFSRDFENVLTQEYTESKDNIRNVGLVSGKYTQSYTSVVYSSDGTLETNEDGSIKTETKEEQIPVTTVVGSAAGFDRYEQFYDETSVSSKTGSGKDAVYLPQSDYIALIAATADTELSKRVEIKTFDSTINNVSNLIYKQDFDLGDKITYLSDDWDVTVDTRITELSEVYEEDDIKVTPTFGNNVPTLIDKIRQMR